MRSARDAIRLRDALRPGLRAVVIGTGFIGCEAAASLAMAGAQVTVMGMDERAAGGPARRGGRAPHRRLSSTELGVELRLGATIERVDDLEADAIVLAVRRAPAR